MNNRKINYDLEQLIKDAKKPGAWQAKLAYATYYLRYNANANENEKALANTYLREIINNPQAEAYKTNALYLHQCHFENKVSLVAQLAIQKVKKKAPQPIFSISRRQSKSPEILYKKIRYKYDQLPSRDNHSLIKTETLAKLTDLLNHRELTDTLRAKIYFQLIRLNIELASEEGARHYLEEAEKYIRLMDNPTLASLNKAGEARKIHQSINPITNKPIYDFKTHVKNSFGQGKAGNEKLFKYVGLIAGNAMDFALLCIPKMFGKNESLDNYVRQGKTFAEEFFKNNGFAALGKYLGRKFGYYVGNIIGGPIAALLGVITYPFFYLYHNYKTNPDIKNIAEKIIKLPKEKKGEETINTSSTHLVSKTIFNHKNDSHSYGLSFARKEMSQVYQEMNQVVNVAHQSLRLPQEGPTNFAYGSLFVPVEKIVKGSPTNNPNHPNDSNKLKPVYKPYTDPNHLNDSSKLTSLYIHSSTH